MVSSSGGAASTINRNEASGGTAVRRRERSSQLISRSAGQFMQNYLVGEHAYGLAITVQSADIHIHLSTLHSSCHPTVREISIDQGSDVLVGTAALDPQLM